MSNKEIEPHAKLVETILDKLEFFISSNMDILFKEADESLFNAAQSATSIAVQNSNFEFMNALREQKGNIERNFVNEFNLYLKPVSELKELPKKKQRNQSNQLGLIEQDEMDEMVILKTISGKAAMELQEELSHLEARFEHLELKTKNIFHGNALEPQHICDSFQEAMNFSDLPSENKLTLYKMFGEYFISQLKTFYHEVNQLMIDDGILPQIELTGKISKTKEREHHQEEIIEDDAIEMSTDEPVGQRHSGGMLNRGRYAQQGSGGQMPGGAGSAAGGMGSVQGSGPSGGMGSMQGGPTGGTGSMQGGAQGGMGSMQGGSGAAGGISDGSNQADSGAQSSVSGGMSAGRPVAQISQSIEGFVGGVPADSDSSLPSGSGGGGFYTHRDVVHALSNIQVDNQLLPDTSLGFDAESIKKALLTAIGDAKGGVVDKRVNQVSEKTIDFIKLIFDAIIDDKGISDAIKTLLLSLQIPIIKAAMIDSEFFIDDQHPARQLLDKLAAAGVGVADHRDPVYIDIEKIVKKLLDDYKEDISAFEDALKSLIDLTESIYLKAREQEQTSQQEIQHRQARNIVLKEIRKVTLGKELPQKVRTLVLKVWPTLMFNHYLRNGKANDEWVEMLMVLEKVIESVQPATSIAELEELGYGNDDIIHAVREKLKSCHKPMNVHGQVLDDLKSQYEELVVIRGELKKSGTLPAEKEPVVEDASVVEEREAEDEAQTIAQNKLDNLPPEVQPGSWYVIYNGEDKPVRRLKLAAILVDEAVLVFVDHLGNVVIEKDAEMFADELEKGLSGIIMQHSVFDHALNAALDSIKK